MGRSGIGITPFLEQLTVRAAGTTTHGPVDLWYCTKTDEEGLFPADLEPLCARSRVTLRRLVAARGERLSVAILSEQLGDLSDAAIWFCGPEGFAHNLLTDLPSTGFDVERSFCREEFTFR